MVSLKLSWNGGGGVWVPADKKRGVGKKGWVFFLGESCIFSQWAMCPMRLRGVKYSSAEQFMIRCKEEIRGDFRTAERIMKMDRPAEQKQLGKGVRGVIEAG